eukprot:Skav220692  [mRNA]  locus=scaffold472:332828:335966:- [translate_table: standard]
MPRAICSKPANHGSTPEKSWTLCFRELMAVAKAVTRKTKAKAKSPTSEIICPHTKTKAEILMEKRVKSISKAQYSNIAKQETME